MLQVPTPGRLQLHSWLVQHAVLTCSISSMELDYGLSTYLPTVHVGPIDIENGDRIEGEL